MATYTARLPKEDQATTEPCSSLHPSCRQIDRHAGARRISIQERPPAGGLIFWCGINSQSVEKIHVGIMSTSHAKTQHRPFNPERPEVRNSMRQKMRVGAK